MTERSDDHAPEGKAADGASLPHSVRSTVIAVRDLGSAWLDLVGTEARIAAHTVTTILALGLSVAVLGVAAWLTLVTAAVAFAMRMGAPLEGALIVTALLHAGIGLLLVFMIRLLSRRLSFPVTRGAIRGGDRHESRTPTQA
ncbi:MAG: hypothetical protein WED00_07485 [Aquisalimonadaceae bacterium]